MQSRYKPGCYNPKAVSKPVVHFPEKNVDQKRSSEIKTTPCPSVTNEDDIHTMVQSLKEVQDTSHKVTTIQIQPLLENIITEISTEQNKVNLVTFFCK